MLQMSSLSFVSNLHGSDGVTVPHVDIVNDDGESSGLYTTILVEGKVRVALRFRCLVQSCYHDNCRNFFRPDHFPEICYSVS